MNALERLYLEHFGSPAQAIRPLQNQLGGSGRRIVRLSGADQGAIGILHDVREENIAFVEFSRHFRRHGLPVPEIYAQDLSQGAYLMEDLGDMTLFQFLSKNRSGGAMSPEALEAYAKVVATLPRFQVQAGRDLDYSVCYPRDSFDRQSISWDLNYFKYYFLKLAGVSFNEQALEDDFGRLTDFLLTAGRDYFLYRDFQSRNVMLRDGDPWFLDYQGGRKGALQYDIASLLYDAKADLPPDDRQRLLDAYLESLATCIDLDRAVFMRHYHAYVYVRLMQAMGAYGFRGFYERKPHFLASVPYALKNLRWLLANAELPIHVPTLMDTFRNLLASDKVQSVGSQPAAGLVVLVQSFSFHQGLPEDESGHGGGFVFDARSLPNPGREERYKQLTGKDAPVISYLAQRQHVQEFFDHAAALVDASISSYRSRGYQNLTVSFGCTGGQHRSVYLAEQLAAHLAGRGGVDVVLRHRALEKMVLT